MKEQKEEQEKVLNNEGDLSLGCDVNMDRVIASKKRDTSFVDERKKQIKLYGNYYPAGLSNEGIIEWCDSEYSKLSEFLSNLIGLKNESKNKIESDRQAKLAATLAGLSETEKEQLKTMLG